MARVLGSTKGGGGRKYAFALLLFSIITLHTLRQTLKKNSPLLEIFDYPIQLAHVAEPSLYPNNKQPIDVYADIPKDVQTNWNCSGCSWMECSNSKDRSLFDEHIVKCLQRWFGIANELGLLSVPIYGTLIASYYRNATILKWEKDIDLWVWAHDVATLIDYQETYNEKHHTGNLSSKFPYESWIEIQEEWKTKYKKARYQRAARFHYELPKRLDFWCGPCIHSTFVDITPIYPDACDPAKQGMDHCRQLVESGNYTTIQFFTKKYQLKQIPKSELFPLEPCYLNGVRASCPAKPVKILNHLYHGIDVALPDHYLNQTTGCWVQKD